MAWGFLLWDQVIFLISLLVIELLSDSFFLPFLKYIVISIVFTYSEHHIWWWNYFDSVKKYGLKKLMRRIVYCIFFFFLPIPFFFFPSINILFLFTLIPLAMINGEAYWWQKLVNFYENVFISPHSGRRFTE